MTAKEINICDIEIGERMRVDYGDLTELEETMGDEEIGQIQSIAVEIVEEGNGKPYLLVAGGRRLAALNKLGKDRVLARVYSPLTDTLRKRIELIENTARKELSWDEKSDLTESVHKLQMDLHDNKSSQHNPDGWSKEKTAKELGVTATTITRELELAEAMKVLPEIRACKTQKDAILMKDRLLEEKLRTELAGRIEIEMAEHNQGQVLIDAYKTGDAFELIKDVPDGSIDFIELDPDYGTGLDVFDRDDRSTVNEGGCAEGYKEYTPKEYSEMMKQITNECARVLKPTGWIICWHSPVRTVPTYVKLNDAGFTVNPAPCIWVKNRMTRNLNPDTTLGKQYEPFFYARKSEAKFSKRGYSNIFTAAAPTKRVHPTQKPYLMMKRIIEVFTRPGDSMLVPFAGSGTSLLAGHANGLNVLGYDLNPQYRDSYCLRVKKYIESPEDFS